MIIGSTAMKHWFDDFNRNPKDLDTFSLNPPKNADNFWHESFPFTWDEYEWAEPNTLYTIKVSHSFWDIHGTWAKHMWDITFLQQKGALFLPEVYDLLLPVWTEKHGKKKVNLSQGKDDFFADAVTRKYDHDSLHDSVAYYDRPLFERILRDGAEVTVDWDKFQAMDYEDQLRLIREEVYATALERWLVPLDYKMSSRAAYARAMKKTVTSLFRGKWALWLVLHYSDLIAPDCDYLQRHYDKSDRLILL